MGGLLSRKADSEWQKVLKSIRWQFTEGKEWIFKILSLSYDDLRYNDLRYSDLRYSLKPCFLYLGIFPEDAEIPANRLIQMWAAEGFLQERGDETLEEVGEDILMELIARSMIHVAERRESGLIKSCRMHDLLRDLAISKAKEDGFLEVSASGAHGGRRMAAHEGVVSCTDLQSSASHLRCVFLSDKDSMMLKCRQEKLLFRRFKLMKVMNLENVRIRKLPGEIGELVHLRYLCCETKFMKSLPSSMVNLCNLQTLYLICDCNEEVGDLHIPNALKKMLQRLRHLQLIIRNAPLKYVLSHNLLDLVRKEALQVCYEKTITLEHSTESSSISELYLVDKKFITNSSSLATLPPELPLLTESSLLQLFGKLKKLPDPCDFPHNLSKLVLKGSYLEQDPLPLLEKLESLSCLEIEFSAFEGKKMTCSQRGFLSSNFWLFES